MLSGEFPQQQSQTKNHINIRGGMDGNVWKEQVGIDGRRQKIELVSTSHGVPVENVTIVSQSEMEQIRREKLAASVCAEAFSLALQVENNIGPLEYDPFDGETLSMTALSRLLSNNSHHPVWTREDGPQSITNTPEDFIERVA